MKMSQYDLVNLLRPSTNLFEIPDEISDKWFQAALDLDDRTIANLLHQYEARTGILEFSSVILPSLIHQIEVAWLEKRLDVHHEHFVSENIRDFLSKKWRERSNNNTGDTAIVSTLPKERHSLGLHIGAAILSCYGLQVRMIGGDTPIPSIVKAVVNQSPDLLLLGYSAHKPFKDARSEILELRQLISADVRIFVGGPKLNLDIPNVHVFNSFSSLVDFLEEHYDD